MKKFLILVIVAITFIASACSRNPTSSKKTEIQVRGFSEGYPTVWGANPDKPIFILENKDQINQFASTYCSDSSGIFGRAYDQLKKSGKDANVHLVYLSDTAWMNEPEKITPWLQHGITRSSKCYMAFDDDSPAIFNPWPGMEEYRIVVFYPCALPGCIVARATVNQTFNSTNPEIRVPETDVQVAILDHPGVIDYEWIKKSRNNDMSKYCRRDNPRDNMSQRFIGFWDFGDHQVCLVYSTGHVFD